MSGDGATRVGQSTVRAERFKRSATSAQLTDAQLDRRPNREATMYIMHDHGTGQSEATLAFDTRRWLYWARPLERLTAGKLDFQTTVTLD